MEKKVKAALDTLAAEWNSLAWNFEDVYENGLHDLISRWQGNPGDDIMVVCFRGKSIHELPHRQEFFFINYVFANSYQAVSAKYDGMITLHQDDFYLGQPYSGYALRGKSKQDIIMIGIHIRKETFLREYLPVLAANPELLQFFLNTRTDSYSDEFIQLNCADDPSIRHLIELMAVEYVRHDASSQIILKTMLMSVLQMVARNYVDHEEQKSELTLAEKVRAMIYAHPDTVSLSAVAEQISYHPNYISTLIHQTYGVTFSSLVLHARMERALSLMKVTDLSIEEISSLVGYANQSAFYKAFNHIYHCSPREYMEKHETSKKENRT